MMFRHFSPGDRQRLREAGSPLPVVDISVPESRVDRQCGFCLSNQRRVSQLPFPEEDRPR
jgi:hypothetical protein